MKGATEITQDKFSQVQKSMRFRSLNITGFLAPQIPCNKGFEQMKKNNPFLWFYLCTWLTLISW